MSSKSSTTDLETLKRNSSPDFPSREFLSFSYNNFLKIYVYTISERRGSTPLEEVKETLLRKMSGTDEHDLNQSATVRANRGSVRALSQKYLQNSGKLKQ